jgi:hypothetical protein
MTEKQILEEIKKCRDNPYYFVTTYIKVMNEKGEIVPYVPTQSEKEFNRIIKDMELTGMILKARRRGL